MRLYIRHMIECVFDLVCVRQSSLRLRNACEIMCNQFRMRCIDIFIQQMKSNLWRKPLLSCKRWPLSIYIALEKLKFSHQRYTLLTQIRVYLFVKSIDLKRWMYVYLNVNNIKRFVVLYRMRSLFAFSLTPSLSILLSAMWFTATFTRVRHSHSFLQYVIWSKCIFIKIDLWFFFLLCRSIVYMLSVIRNFTFVFVYILSTFSSSFNCRKNFVRTI